MRERRKLVIGFGTLGFLYAISLYAYLEFTSFATLPKPLLIVAICFCPASVLSVVLFDVQPRSVEMAIGWSVIALINGALYAVFALGVAQILRKPRAGVVERGAR